MGYDKTSLLPLPLSCHHVRFIIFISHSSVLRLLEVILCFCISHLPKPYVYYLCRLLCFLLRIF